MSFLSRILGREQRASVRASDPYLAEFFGAGGGILGQVDTGRASGLAVAHRCIALIAESLASVPLCVYRNGERGARDRAQDHALYGVLHDAPNNNLTAFEFREALVASLLTHGNAYAKVTRNGRGQTVALHLVNPGAVSVERLVSNRMRYTITGSPPEVLVGDEMLHLRYRLRPDGFMGLSPIAMARDTFAIALAQGDTAGKQAAKGFRPEGALIFPQLLGMAAKEQSLDALRRKVESNEATSNILVLDGGAEWKPLAFSSKDAEFLESRKLTALDICRVFGVPPSAAGITDNATYSNIGEESRALVQRCIAPMARRIEQAMNRTLLTPEARKTFFVEHDLAGLLRGDLGARYAASIASGGMAAGCRRTRSGDSRTCPRSRAATNTCRRSTCSASATRGRSDGGVGNPSGRPANADAAAGRDLHGPAVEAF